MQCINTDYPAFCYCEEVATPMLYFMGVAKLFYVLLAIQKIYFCSIQMYIQPDRPAK